MDDQAPDTASRPRHGCEADQRLEPVRTRWTPKPEQILILESIFNSGMVNPPKEETVRIRKLLEKFGAVGDANVFYWFQNRRSRSRRRQRQMQASLSGGDQPPRSGGGGIPYENIVASAFAPNSLTFSSPNCLAGSSSSNCGLEIGNCHNLDGFFSSSGHSALAPDYLQNPVFCSADSPNLPYQSEVITVFINGVATEVGRGHLDMKAMFGGDYVLYHSSGIPVQVNEYGFLVQGLQHGESYFLVSRHS